jgi:hypothetical protein
MGIFLFVVVAVPAALTLILARILHLHSRLFLSVLISSSQQGSVLLLLCILLEWQFHHLTHLMQHEKKAGKGARYGKHQEAEEKNSRKRGGGQTRESHKKA